MNYDVLVKFLQGHFTDGLVLVVGSGLSAAEGIPGMPALADHLSSNSSALSGADAAAWSTVEPLLKTDGLEAALLKHPPPDSLEAWIANQTASLLLPAERAIMSAVVNGTKALRLSTFLSRVLKSPSGLPILTPNYDRLIELACEMSGFHVDTTAVGHYAGAFDHTRSCMGSCRGITTRAKVTTLDHFPRAIVLKPHGSFDWYRFGGDARRCSLDLDAERLIITPGLNKYRAGYNAPFDKHRDLANDYIKQAARLLIIGYGFNDDHLQTHLMKRIQGGTPTLILNRSMNARISTLADNSPRCIAITKGIGKVGIAVQTTGAKFEHAGAELWDIGVLAKEILA